MFQYGIIPFNPLFIAIPIPPVREPILDDSNAEILDSDNQPILDNG